MTIDWNRTQSKTIIEHLTVRYRGTVETMNATTLRAYVERLLDSVDLQPTGFSSGAVLMVRKIQELAPLPTTALARFTQPERELWLEQVRSQMATLYAMAARPIHHQVPSNANAVLFADPAEMLACLTQDILTGQAGQHWYWQRVLSHMPSFPAAALTYLWSTHATFLPAILATLQPGEVYAAMTLLSPVELRQVTHALHRSFDLPASLSPSSEHEYAERSPAVLSSEDETKTPTSSATVFSGLDDSKRYDTRVPFIAPPWQRWISDASQSNNMSPEAHYLLGLSLTLYHAPSLARSASFARQTAVWVRSYKRATQKTDLSGSDTDSNTRASSPAMQDMRADTSTASSQPMSIRPKPDTTSVRPTAALSKTSSVKEQPRIEQDIPTASGTHIVSEQEQIQHVSDDLSAPMTTNTPATHDTGAFESGTARTFPNEGIPTQLGGILYLINLLPLLKSRIAEDVFAQYTSGWGLIEALAKGLLGTLYTHYEDDSMWDVLASLDGREGAQSIASSSPIDTSRDRCIASASPIDSEEDAIIPFNKLRGISVGTDLSRPFGNMNGDEDVINRSLPVTEAYHLLTGLLNEPSLDMHQVAQMVLCKYGQVIVSRTHVDLYMSMEEITLPVRRAGLDRDPGWIPDLARIVLFHFD